MFGLVLLATTATAILPQSIAFEQFAVSERFVGKPAQPNLSSHPDARTYRTVLARESQAGPNFAGHFTLVRIGCGTGCSRVAVVEAGHGTVYFPAGLSFTFTAGWWHEPIGPVFQLTSRLLVVYGQAGTETAPYGISYFEWTGTDFKLLKFEPHSRGEPKSV
jgi:hypothetical protein